MIFEPVMALEIHAQLLTATKIFCGCTTRFGAAPNSQVCPICLGMPGVLPTLNQATVSCALRAALATHCQIAPYSIFARKNYFYPDLPKGYQISQYELPLATQGYLDLQLDQQTKRIRIHRIHLEEDAGKSIHAEDFVAKDESLLDLNRCGTPLIEIVSEPDFRTTQEVYVYLSNLRQILRYLEVCDGNMEEGSLRCDANISLRPRGTTPLGVKTELKNMNSFHNVVKALEFEIQRQTQILTSGGRVIQETLLWDAAREIAYPMRSKEMAHDYRYFPEPDLVPLEISADWIAQIRSSLPELPQARQRRFQEQYALTPDQIEILTENRELADYFEACLAFTKDLRNLSNWLLGEVLRVVKEQKLTFKNFPVSPENLARLIELINQGTISLKLGKMIFEKMLTRGASPDQIMQEQDLVQLSNTDEIALLVQQVLDQYPSEVKKYLEGKEQVLRFLVGQVMRATQGKANPNLVNALLKKNLDALKCN
ncbi:Asp-tRNA(Asn)/Glu-tRNA(Gln) amidotransferase subunit GatB [candidate division KSB1 bacterium]|nr:Asp-tRNA(Asn)/Glu-tRNA(Gln) amidotransferase subunit GatB [candidate division KSB1 bacterium]